MSPTLALSPETRRKLLLGAALTAVLLVLAGCGRRGALEPPPGAVVAPQPAASQRLVAPVAQVTTSDRADLDGERDVFFENKGIDGQTRPAKVAPAPVDPNAPKREFFLDSLVK